MEIQAFKDYEVAKIYKSKLIYSIIKYDQQSSDFKELIHDKYCNALNFNNSSFDYSIMDDVTKYLDKEMNKYKKIALENQDVVDLIADQLVNNFTNEASKITSDIEKCRFLFEYVAKTINYDHDTKKYNRFVPFGEDYPFEFYNGIPISNSYKGLLVTKNGLSDSISNLMVLLGRKIGLDIDVTVCQNYNGNYCLNKVIIDDYLSYMDVTSVINGNNTINDAFLVDRATLLKNNNYSEIEEEGVLIPINYSKPYNFNKLINDEEEILPKVKYLESDLFNKKKTL